MARKSKPRGKAVAFHGPKPAKKSAKTAQAEADSESNSVSVSESSAS